MKGLVLVAGKGVRLRPLTYTEPKHLIPLAGKPMMQYAIEHLTDAGVKEIGIVVGYMKDLIIRKFGDGSQFNAKFEYIVQEPQMGIAHAIKVSQEYIGDDPFVVYLGDNIFKEGIRRYVKEFESNDCDAMILLTHVENPTSFGVVELKDGKIVRLVEKPKVPPSNYALVGVYFFTESIFRAIDNIRPSWRGELEITDAIQWLLDNGYKIHYDIIRGWWKDTGKPEDLLEALYLILDNIDRNVKGTIEEGAEVLGRVHIGEGTIIKSGASIRGPAYIGRNCIIGPNTFIGPYTSIEDNTKILGGEISSSLILDDCYIELHEDDKIVDSIIGRGTKITRRIHKRRGFKLIIGETSTVEV
ncbi:MAG: glucose-1-phosphate thymidylyltransferase [Crenarchaeota archaeon]|nr:glucose-1-phosphate thymidylyltransferase [Thermoproteota archaeon]